MRKQNTIGKRHGRRKDPDALPCRRLFFALVVLLTGSLLMQPGPTSGQLLAAGIPAAGQARATSFPSVTADALDKQRVTLPSGLEGRANLLLLSFASDQGNQLETWTAVSQALQHTDAGFRAYRIPVAERANAIFRWWANASLRSEETDPDLWHWVVPIYVEKKQFREQLGIADEKSIVAMLVDKTGRVLWRATGTSSLESRAALMAAATTASGTH